MQAQKIETNESENEIREISFKEFVLDVKYLFNLLLKNWKKLLLISLFAGLAIGLKIYFTPPTYKAKIVFMIDDDQGSSFSSTASALLGRFGFGGGGKLNQYRILEISKSQKIIFDALFRKDSLMGRYDYNANFIIDLYNLKYKDKLIHFKNSDYSNFSFEEKKMLKILYEFLVGENGLLVTDFNEDSGLMFQTLTTLNDTLSVNMLKTIYRNLSDFYIDKSTQKELNNYNNLKQKSDSLYRLLNKQERNRSSLNDSSLGLYLETDKLPAQIQDRNSRITLMMYGEVLKNLEISEFALKTKTPIIIPVDEPFPPLKPEKKSLIIYPFLGIIFGLFVTSLYIVINDKYKKAMNS